LETRVVQFVEQLVPCSLLDHYHIKTQTPLPSATSDLRKAKFEPVLEIEESDKAIRAVLMNYSIQPSGKMKENRRMLKQLADEMGRKLVYVHPQ
jgi:hypothetical protein